MFLQKAIFFEFPLDWAHGMKCCGVISVRGYPSEQRIDIKALAEKVSERYIVFMDKIR